MASPCKMFSEEVARQQASCSTLLLRSKDDETVCTGFTTSTGSPGSVLDIVSSNEEDATTGSLMPHITLSRGGPLIVFLRQVPLVLLMGGLLAIVLSVAWCRAMFSIILLCLNAIMLANFTCCGLYGLIGTTLSVPACCDRDWNGESEQIAGVFDVQHYVIIPSYKEDLSVLDATVQAVADSPIARRCIRVVLAMEARDPDAKETAQQLVEKFSNSFLELFSTMHPKDLPGEVAGKSSNAAWAFAKVSAHARNLQLKPGRTVISVNDADCLWHPNYFQAVSLDVLKLNEETAAWMIWQAPQMQLRNHFHVPVLTRMTGMSSALFEISGLRWSCGWGMHIAFSSYTMLLELADHVGGWDADVIAEDHHMFTKCYFASTNDNGVKPCKPRLRIQPVFLPVKSYMVESEHGSNTIRDYIASLQARLVQARRHTQGAEEIPYVLLQWVETLRFWGVRNVPFGIHFGAFRLVWIMLCSHTFSYLQYFSVVLANVYWMRHIYGAQAMKGFIHFPVETCAHVLPSGWMHLHCLVFTSLPWLFMVPLVLSVLGHFAVVRLFTVRTARSKIPLEDAECSDGKALLEADESQPSGSQIWYAERGGSAGCPILHWRVVMLMQIAFETTTITQFVIIAFGFLPTVCAVWHIALGKDFSYRTASKPLGAGIAKNSHAQS